MKLFVVTGQGFPPLIFKADTRGEVLERFSEGIEQDELRRLVNHPTFMIQELTLALLTALAPDEFKLDDDCGF